MQQFSVCQNKCHFQKVMGKKLIIGLVTVLLKLGLVAVS